MRDWPEELRERYPLRQTSDSFVGRVRAVRPWWAYHDRGAASVFSRGVGRAVATLRGGATPVSLRRRDVDDILAEIREIDAADPLPHPGLRVGQVWADVDAVAVQIIQCEKAAAFVVVGDRGYFSPEQMAMGFPFLVADPCCPWLAPWAQLEAS